MAAREDVKRESQSTATEPKTTWIFKAGKCTTSSFLVWYRNRQKKRYQLGGMGLGVKCMVGVLGGMGSVGLT